MRPRGGCAGRIGGAPVLLGLLLLCAAAGGGILFLLLRGDAPAPRTRLTPPPSHGGVPRPETAVESSRAETSATEGRSAPPAPEPAAADLRLSSAGRPPDPRRFEGSGELRGEVHARGGPLPASWTLVLSPSRFLVGSERAESREVTYEGTNAFHVEDLPLAGYDVRVLAPGWNSRAVPLLLERGSPSAFLNLELLPAGFLEGSLLQADRLPAEGIALLLEALADGARRETTSDAAGVFRFDGVLDGNYRLIVGHPDNPLVEPLSLSLETPGMALPPITLPPLGTVSFVAVDPVGGPLSNVHVIGAGTNGGRIDGITDPSGRLTVHNLPLGRYRIRAEHASENLRRESFELTSEEPLEVLLRLLP